MAKAAQMNKVNRKTISRQIGQRKKQTAEKTPSASDVANALLRAASPVKPVTSPTPVKTEREVSPLLQVANRAGRILQSNASPSGLAAKGRIVLPTVKKAPAEEKISPLVTVARQKGTAFSKAGAITDPLLKAAGLGKQSLKDRAEMQATPKARAVSGGVGVKQEGFSSGMLNPNQPKGDTYNGVMPENFVKTPWNERVGAFVQGTGNWGMHVANQIINFIPNLAGKTARENLEVQQNAPQMLEELDRQIEAAKAARDMALYMDLQKERAALRTKQLTGGNVFDPLLALIPEYSSEDTFSHEAEANRKKLYTGLSKGQRTAVNLAEMGANQLFNYGMSGATGIPLPVYTALTGGAEAGQEALDKGHDAGTAGTAALGSGLISYGVEKMGGVAGDWGERLLGKIAGTSIGQKALAAIPDGVKSFISGLSQNKVMQILGDGLSEGAEEWTEYDLQRMFKNLVLDEDTPFDVKEALSNAAGGFLFGSVVKGTETLGDWAVRKITGNPNSGNQNNANLSRVDSDGSLGYSYEQQNGPRMVDYGDQETKARIMAEVGGRMAQEGKIVRVTDADLADLRQYYPDLRGIKRADQPQIKRETQKKFRAYIKDLLHETFDGKDIEFSMDGDVIEARLYSEGINHVANHLTQQKTAMLERSEELFSKAEYLYSTANDVHSKASENDRIKRWDYFYTPIEIDGELKGVRIAVKHTSADPKAQVYDWNIKQQEADFRPKDGGMTPPAPIIGTSSQLPIDTISIPQLPKAVNPSEQGNFWGLDRLLDVQPQKVDLSPWILPNTEFQEYNQWKKDKLKQDIEQDAIEGSRKKGGPPRIFPEPRTATEQAGESQSPWLYLENLTGQKSKKQRQLEEKRKADLAEIKAAEEAARLAKTQGDRPPMPETAPMEEAQKPVEYISEVGIVAQGETVPETGFSGESAESNPRTAALKKAQAEFYQEMNQVIPVTKSREARGEISTALDEAAAEYATYGEISKETADRIFEKLYDSATVTDNGQYNTFKSLKREIRETKFYLSEADRADIVGFESFRKSNAGNFTVTKKPGEGVPVDVKYQELAGQYPQFFPSDITHPAAQLEQISEVSKSIAPVIQSLDEINGSDAEAARASAREEFQKALDAYAGKLSAQAEGAPETEIAYGRDRPRLEQKLSEEERTALESIQDILYRKDAGLTKDSKKTDQLIEAYRKVDSYQAAAHPEGLDKDSSAIADDLAAGRIDPETVNWARYDRETVENAAEARKKQAAAQKFIDDYNDEYYDGLFKQAKDLSQFSDEWVDKRAGLWYSRETMERNFRDIAKGKHMAEIEALIDTYFTPVHEHEAERLKFTDKMYDPFRKMKLTKAEREWAHAIGDGAETYENLPLDMDAMKIHKAIETAKANYKKMYDLGAAELVSRGYSPPGYIEDYLPHFNDPDDPLVRLFAMFGMEINTQELPTEIAGNTANRTPGKPFFGNFQHREGTKTDYDLLKGYERYVEGISNVLYHTGDIQKIRALEQVLRDKYSKNPQILLDEATKKRMPQDIFRDEETDKTFAKDVRHLPNLVTQLREYANILAGKKSLWDRPAESDFGRRLYSISKAISGRVSSNQTGYNYNTVLTNLIPGVQGLVSIKKQNYARALWEEGKNIWNNDGFEDRSAFLTNRRGTQALVRNNWNKVKDGGHWMMENFDLFTANVLTRGKYYDNLDAGMSEAKAMREADKWAASLMADRSKGATPTLFERKSPLWKLVTTFQLETNNQLSYLFKDLPRNAGSAGKLAAQAAQLILYSWLANNLFEEVTGRRPMLDIAGMVEGAVEDWREDGPMKALSGLGQEIAGQIPAANSVAALLGSDAGRLPISAGVPNILEIGKAAFDGDAAPNYRAERILGEVSKPVYYLLPPTGGGQLKKTLEGAEALLNAGSYKTQSDGGEKLQYPVNQDFWTGLQALTFGKSSTKGAREYYDNGYKQVLPENMGPNSSRGGEAASNSVESVPAQQEAEESWFDRLFPVFKGGRNEAQMRSLPRVVKYTVGEDENKQEGQVELSSKEYKAFQQRFMEFLPENMEGLDEKAIKRYYQFAEEAAKDEVLAEKGLPGYEPQAWIQKAQEAVAGGIPIDQYMAVKDVFDQLKPITNDEGEVTKTGVQRKRDYLFRNQNLTPEQKQLLDRIFLQSGEDKKRVDYSSENSYRYSLMADRAKAQYDAVSAAVPGMPVADYQKFYRGMMAVKGREEQLKYLMRNGANRQQAYAFYAIAHSDEESVSGMAFDNPGEVCYAFLSDSNRRKYDDLRYYFPNLSAADFWYIQDNLSLVRGDRDGNGKTVSGSFKRNKLAMLLRLGLTERQAVVYLNVVGG